MLGGLRNFRGAQRAVSNRKKREKERTILMLNFEIRFRGELCVCVYVGEESLFLNIGLFHFLERLGFRGYID